MALTDRERLTTLLDTSEVIEALNSIQVSFFLTSLFFKIGVSNSEQIDFVEIDNQENTWQAATEKQQVNLAAGVERTLTSYKSAIFKQLFPVSTFGKKPLEDAINETIYNARLEMYRTIEVMVAEVMHDGSYTNAEGANSFNRDADMTKALTGTNTWNGTAASILDNIADWVSLISRKGGGFATNIIMGDDAFDAFTKNAAVQAHFNILNSNIGTLKHEAVANMNATYGGYINSIHVYRYSGGYNKNGSHSKFIPAKSVIVCPPEVGFVKLCKPAHDSAVDGDTMIAEVATGMNSGMTDYVMHTRFIAMPNHRNNCLRATVLT